MILVVTVVAGGAIAAHGRVTRRIAARAVAGVPERRCRPAEATRRDGALGARRSARRGSLGPVVRRSPLRQAPRDARGIGIKRPDRRLQRRARPIDRLRPPLTILPYEYTVLGDCSKTKY